MSLSKLPDELLLVICEKIERVRDLVSLSCCSKRLNFVCRDVNYVNDVYHIDKNEQVEKALSFNKNIKLKLDLSWGKKVSDFEILGKVYDLNLSYCDNVSNVSIFQIYINLI